jgi:uncharacterized protein
MTQTVTDPTGSQERIHTLDILRGFALFGMIVVHFHQRVNTQVTGWEDLIGWFVWVGVETKSWGTFAFLFGVGFAVLLRRMEARGGDFTAFYLRRLFILACFGVIAETMFGFKILLEYAVWGVPLLFIRRLSSRTLFALAVLAIVITPVIMYGAAVHWWPPMTSPLSATTIKSVNPAIEIANLNGSFFDLMVARARSMIVHYVHPAALLPNVNLALFILGMLALRHGLIDEPRKHVRAILGWMGYGFAVWAIYWLVMYRRLSDIPWQFQHGFGLLNEQWLCFTFIGGIMLLIAYRPEWQRRLGWFGWAGRMALTNYMLQIAVLDYLVSGYGLSLHVRPILGMVGAVMLFGVEVLFSKAWLAHYRFGPLEWVWRSLTYGRAQPMRRTTNAQPAAAL